MQQYGTKASTFDGDLRQEKTNEKISIISLNVAVALSAVAFLTGIARLILEVRFVPEIVNSMPENQPGQVALLMLIPVAFFGGWLWALLAAVRNKRRGLIAALIFALLLAFGWGLPTVVAFCPTPCATVAPLTDIITWSNVVVGLIAAIAIGVYLASRP
jgi:hypothetical protein